MEKGIPLFSFARSASVEEDGESILCAIEDEEELEAVYELIMEQLYEEEDEEE